MSHPSRVNYQTDPAQYKHWTLSFDGPVGELQHLPVLWRVEPPATDGEPWQGRKLDLDMQGKWSTTERRSSFT